MSTRTSIVSEGGGRAAGLELTGGVSTPLPSPSAVGADPDVTISCASFLRPAALLLALLAGAAPAVAQPYVYAVTGRSVTHNLSYLTTLPTRLVTIDPVAGQAIASLTLTGCADATGVAVRTDGVRVFVSCSAGLLAGSVLVIDPVAKQIVTTRTFASAAGGVALTPAGDRLIVPLAGGTAEVLDPASLATIGTINVGAVPGAVTPVLVSNDGATAYIAQPLTASGRLVVASLTGFTVVTTIDFGTDNISGIALTGDGARLIVGHQALKVSIVNTATNSVTATVPVPSQSLPTRGVAADAGSRGFVTSFDSVQVINLASGAIAGEIPRANTNALGMSATRDRLYAAESFASLLTSVNPNTGTVVSSAVVKGGIISLAAPAASPAITANPCTYALSFTPSGTFHEPGSLDPAVSPPRASPVGSNGWRIDVIALPDRCTWTAQSDVPWLTFEYTNGTGPDNVGVTIAPNNTGRQRTGTIAIGGQTLTVTQAGCTNPIVFIDRPIANSNVSSPFEISGWAIDTCAPSGTGMEEVTDARNGYGVSRPDVGAAFGAQFTNSGFGFFDTGEMPGAFQLEQNVYFRDTVTGKLVFGTARAHVLASIAPFGVIDTPAEGATVAGDMGLTGWVMDDIQLLGFPLIYRDALPGEATSPDTFGKVFLGAGTRVTGARPDVQKAFPSYAENDRAGFGAVILTNALPNGGNGTFNFYVLIADQFHITWLGPRTVTADNAHSPQPFGAIDTPGPGQTVSGAILVQGWMLTPGTAMIPTDGSTIDVIVDDAIVGHPTYNLFRPDVQALFPAYTNSNGAGASFNLDTRTLSNGMHTIAWVVRDNAGHASGIGSRFFTVSNQ